MKRRIYNIYRRGDGWGCKLSGEWIAVDHCASFVGKETFVSAVKDLARQNRPSEVVVHTRNGKIGKGHGSRTTYGNDPEKSKG